MATKEHGSFALINHFLVRNHQISLKTASLRYADELVRKNGLEIVYFVKFLHSLHIEQRQILVQC